MTQVLVTGGSGFIASHCILKLLEEGFDVRATVRDLRREEAVRSLLAAGGYQGAPERISFFAADLNEDAGWEESAEGCTYVLHVASPFPAGVPAHEDALIRPARDGALRVLRAARNGGAKRVVLTSSFAAVGYGHPEVSRAFTERDWTDLSRGEVTPYPKSKTLAERAAWDFIAEEGGPLELAVVNPVGVFGPVLGADFSTSVLLVQRLLDGAVPGLPRLHLGVVDVRDVADLHLRAMLNPIAAGERFLAVAGRSMSAVEVARLLKQRLGPAGRRVPTRELPDWLVRLVALADPAVRLITPELGVIKEASHEKASSLLGWAPRSNEEAILATAESLIALGLVKGV